MQPKRKFIKVGNIVVGNFSRPAIRLAPTKKNGVKSGAEIQKIRENIKRLRNGGVKGKRMLRGLIAESPLYKELAK